MSNEKVDFNQLVQKMKNSSPIRKDDTEEDVQVNKRVGERENSSLVAEPKKKGRPKKETILDLNIGINVFLDKPLHKKLQFAKAETDIGIKDLIYMATDYVMEELFKDGVPNREGERVIRNFKEKMFGQE